MTLRCILCSLFLVTPVLADDALMELKTPLVSGPYCGIHSLYFCLDSLGIKIEFVDFVSTRFVGSPQGSSAGELIDAAQHFGAHAEVFSNLTQAELYRIKQPMILHVRSTWENSGYNHWIAFLGFEGHHAKIIDHSRPIQDIPLAELLAKWDGTAIVISNEKGNIVATSFAVINRHSAEAYCLKRLVAVAFSSASSGRNVLIWLQ